MIHTSEHTFHIPVLGIGYSIDTPIKVARFGISSVVSIIHTIVLEQMREFYCDKYREEYIKIPNDDIDHRAKIVTAYLDLMKRIIDKQMEEIVKEPFEEGKDIVKYFTMLPDDSALKQEYFSMTKMNGQEKIDAQNLLRKKIIPGSIDVNIMTKVDNLNYNKKGELLPVEYSDATSSLRGYANSQLSSSIIFSAGMNPRLFSFLEKMEDFFPDSNKKLKKKIILKVSNYRSALIQGKFLAKKGLWVSEFRIESGLNCGGHAFPTEGHLLGPILEEFKLHRNDLNKELLSLCNQALIKLNRSPLPENTETRISVQGGIGTHQEDKFLREYYQLDATGWGSPFLLVPEATNVDDTVLKELSVAKQEDYYLSNASPLGVPFNNFRRSTSEEQRKKRIEKNRPGSPCYIKYLAFNTEFTDIPICTSSREYQYKKLNQINADPSLSEAEKKRMIDELTEKDCLCEGLASPALQKNDIKDLHNLSATTICPGPNLAYFSGIISLEDMIGHIYGRVNKLNDLYRPHVFINELKLYVDYLKRDIEKNMHSWNDKQEKYVSTFKENLFKGVEYYKELIPKMANEAEEIKKKMKEELDVLKTKVCNLNIHFPKPQMLTII